MKKEMISLTLGNIDSRFIEEAELYSADEKQGKSLKNAWRRTAIAVAAVLCVALIGVPAAAGTFEGFFKDITRFDGAVVGVTYENATDEIRIEVSGADASGMSVISSCLKWAARNRISTLQVGKWLWEILKFLTPAGRKYTPPRGSGSSQPL